MKELKQFSVEVDGKEYSCKWSTWAYRQYAKQFAELESRKDQMSEIAYGSAFMDVSLDVVRAMLIRASMPGDSFDDMDADETTVLASAVLSWYMDSMNKITASIKEDDSTKNVQGDAKEKITTP